MWNHAIHTKAASQVNRFGLRHPRGLGDVQRYPPEMSRMGVTYELVNADRRNKISFRRLAAWKQMELIGNPATSALTTAYLFDHAGDRIAFVPDVGPSPFHDLSLGEMNDFDDLTDVYISRLVNDGILLDDGILDDPDIDPPNYLRNIRSNWPTKT